MAYCERGKELITITISGGGHVNKFKASSTKKVAVLPFGLFGTCLTIFSLLDVKEKKCLEWTIFAEFYRNIQFSFTEFQFFYSYVFRQIFFE
jgi:hypothetical protein